MKNLSISAYPWPRFLDAERIVILLIFCASSAGLSSQETEGKKTSPDAANQSAQRAKKLAVPKHDPTDQLFRLAPMAEASRTIAISLATNLHIAFDSQLLRTHSAWIGPSLNLFGPPYHGGKSPFLCTIDGTAIWTMPQFCPWTTTPPSVNVNQQLPPGARFTGLRSKESDVVLMYELGLRNGKPVTIHETPRAFRKGDFVGIVRRFEVGPAEDALWFCAHAETNAVAKLARSGAAVSIRRGNNLLMAFSRSSQSVSWAIVQGAASFDEALNDDEKGESVVRRRVVSAELSRAFLKIPPHSKPIAFELLSTTLGKMEDGDVIVDTFLQTTPAPPNLEFLATSNPNRDAGHLKIVAGDKAATMRASGDEFYRIEHFPLPREINLQVTGMDWLSKNELAVSTWSGEIYVVRNASGPVESATYARFARGLNEPLGLKVFERKVYVVQKPELTRISDSDGDGEADMFETINADWGYTGNYHAFAFGPLIDRRKNFYAFLCGQHGRWDVPFVGWCVKVSSGSEKLEGFCSGLRAPNGFGFYGPDDDLFIADNQGNWVGACKLNHLQKGKFYGFPSGTPSSESEFQQPKMFAPPAVWFPRRLSPSTSGFVTIEDDRFGPFKGQMLAGDFQNAVVVRIFLEKVNGEWQGAVWPFAKGFLSGVNRLSFGPDGKLYVGGLKNVSWAASAPRDYSLERVGFTDQMPFEIKEVHALRDGFDLFFTGPVQAASAGNAENFDVRQFTYLYHQPYGSPEIDHAGKKDSATPITVKQAAVSPDGLHVRLTLEGAKTGFVTWVRCQDIVSAEGKPLWHDGFYYTLNQIPNR